jgi:von Willebrand factor type A C-terminal domain/von Willebrand factor type A domain
MADFSAEVYQNEYLPAGGTDVHAVVTVTCSGAGSASESEGGVGEVLIIDTSGSMESPSSKIRAARQAAAAALDEMDDGTWFAVISGTNNARLAYPDVLRGELPMVRMSADTRTSAKEVVKRLDAKGGTAIGSWIELATMVFNAVPDLAQRHAILLTDGKNESETKMRLQGAVEAARGVFQCDCRGVGADWNVDELRYIAAQLLGSVDIIADPKDMAEDFAGMIRAAMSRGVSNARLRVWTPLGAQLLFVRQVAPTIDELAGRRTQVSDLIGEYDTGAWGDESRDFHVAVRVPAKEIGNEQLAARVQLMVGDEVKASGLVRAVWSDDSGLTTRINPAVAHYTGQVELAQAIQEGLAAKASGDKETATSKLGRAVQLAKETGNDEATSRLKKIVDVEDADTGTVRLKRDVAKLDEMELDTRSTKTTRVK